MNNKTKKEVASVQITSEEKSALLLEAESQGLTISQLLRKKLNDEKPTVEQPEPQPKPSETVLSTESLLAIDAIVSEKIAVIKRIPPERDYLRKISGQTMENQETLSDEEEKFLETLSSGIKAEAVENLLAENNSVPIAPLFETEIQKRTFAEMMEKRNEIVSEKTPSFTSLFMKAIAAAFFEDARVLYNRNLFKATYGMSYEEFKAVFIPEN